MRKIRVAILGMGNMGGKHLDILREMEEVEVVALCAHRAATAVAYNEEHGTDFPVYEDFDRMLAERDMDALYVCLPPFAHCGQIEKAARKGIHIFNEKPIALTLERGQSMVDAIAEKGVYTQVGYHMRFGKAVRRVRELVESGIAGRPTLFSANYECNSLHTPWWRDRSKSGGQILEQIIHLYDMAYYMVGDVETVTGFIANIAHQNIPDYTVEDTSSVALRFKNGALGSVTATNNGIPNRWVGIFKIVFENMVAEFSDHNHCRIIFTKENNREEIVAEETDRALAEEDRYFIDVLLGKRPPFATMAEGLTGLKIVTAACTSASNDGCPVKIAQ